MPEISTREYTIRPSDSRNWILVRSPAGIEVDVEIPILNYRYDCRPQKVLYNDSSIFCSRLCCYCGCYAAPVEIEKVQPHLEEIKPLLQADAREVLSQFHDMIYLPEDYDAEENLYKIRCAPQEWETHSPDPSSKSLSDTESTEEQHPIPGNHCLFLMSNGLCAVHKFFLDRGENWVTNKFNICVTFPLDIRPKDKTLAFMSGFDKFTFAEVSCISPNEQEKGRLKMPQIIESCKYAIVDRYGEEWWNALNAAAKDWRAHHIDLDYLYREDEEKKRTKKI